MYTREEMEQRRLAFEEEQRKRITNYIKMGIGFVIGILLAAGLSALVRTFAHKLENQNLAVVQSFSGTVEVRRAAGWWFQPWLQSLNIQRRVCIA